jgi:hypothetical protein
MWGPWDLPNAKIHFTPEKLELQKSYDTVCLMSADICHGHHLPSSQRKPASVFWKISTRLSVFRWTCIAISPFSLSEETEVPLHCYRKVLEELYVFAVFLICYRPPPTYYTYTVGIAISPFSLSEETEVPLHYYSKVLEELYVFAAFLIGYSPAPPPHPPTTYTYTVGIVLLPYRPLSLSCFCKVRREQTIYVNESKGETAG